MVKTKSKRKRSTKSTTKRHTNSKTTGKVTNSIVYEHRTTTDLGAKKIIKVLLKHPVAVVNVDTGGGKTFMSIRAVGVYDPNSHIVIFTTKKQTDSHNWEDSIDAYNHAVKKSHLTYQVTNYESLWTSKGQHDFLAELKKHKHQNIYIIADEGHRIKNPTSKTFKNLYKLTKLPNFKKTIILTATPLAESLLDAQSYLILAGYYRNKSDFLRQHVVRYDKYFQPIIKDWSGQIHNEWLLNYQSIIKEFKSIQVYVDTDALKPRQFFKELTFSYNKNTQKAYRKIAKDYRNGVYDSIASANAAQRDFIAQHDTQRRKALSSIINNPNRPKGPVLIFYQYNSELQSLKDYLPHAHPSYHIFEINGKHKYDVRQTPPEKSLFLCQYQASGEGLNAAWSHCSIFYAPTYSWKNFKQARGRNVRAYQGGTTYQIRFVVKKTINEHYWYDLIDNKKKFTHNLMKQYLTNDD